MLPLLACKARNGRAGRLRALRPAKKTCSYRDIDRLSA
jgi:hypothetical protein